MTTEQRSFLAACAGQYKTDLNGNILPFWMKFGYDRTHGGVYTCVDRDGTLMDTTKSSAISCPKLPGFRELILSG